MEKLDIHIVGLGNLGSAFVNGLIDREDINLYLYDDSDVVRKSIQDKFLITPGNELSLIERGVLILCVKPQNINDFFNNNKDKLGTDILICSPVAGLEIKTIESYTDNKILRIMPNLLIKDNNGFIPYASNYDDDYLAFKVKVLEGLGVIKEFEEDMFPLITALSGSGPAWFYELSSQLVNSGQELGLSFDDAEMIIKELVKALPSLVDEDSSFKDLVSKVKSPNGTTEAGLNSLNKGSFDTIILDAIQKATQRSIEISRELSNE